MRATHSHLVMHPYKKKVIQGLYFTSQILAIGSSFAGSMFGFYDYMHPDTRAPDNPTHYLWILGPGLLAAAVGSFTAQKFQGQKIGVEEDHDAPPQYSEHLAPHNFRSKTAERAYLLFAASLSISNNYILFAGLNAFVTNSPYPILPPGWTGISLFLIKSFIVDLLLDGSSAIFEACEEIKEMFTGSKAGTQISKLFRPIAVRPKLLSAFIFWVQTAGVLSHTGTDVIGLILSVPSLLSIMPGISSTFDTLRELVQTPALFYPLILTGLVLFFANTSQALYFEAKESEHNLKRIRDDHSLLTPYPMLQEKDNDKNVIHKFLLWAPRSKNWIKRGFYTQGPLHAFGDLLPVILLLRDFFGRYGKSNNALSVGLTISLSLLVFVGSGLGTHYSEVTTAVHHFETEFKEIGEDNNAICFPCFGAR